MSDRPLLTEGYPDMGEPPPDAVLESHYDFVSGRTELICRVGRRAVIVGYMNDAQQIMLQSWVLEIDWHLVRAQHPELWEKN